MWIKMLYCSCHEPAFIKVLNNLALPSVCWRPREESGFAANDGGPAIIALDLLESS